MSGYDRLSIANWIVDRTHKPVINTTTRNVTFWNMLFLQWRVEWRSEGWSWSPWPRWWWWCQGRPIIWMHKDDPLVFGRIYSYLYNWGHFRYQLLINCCWSCRCVWSSMQHLLWFTKVRTFSPDERPCYSLCNSNVHNRLESPPEEFATRETTT